MIDIEQVIIPERCLVDAGASSKKSILDLLAEFTAKSCTNITKAPLFDALVARESLGATGLGHGCALPHCRLSQATSVVGSLVRTRAPVPFDTLDNEPVDLFCVLVIPEKATKDQLSVLNRMARTLKQTSTQAALRAATDAVAMHKVLLEKIKEHCN